MKNFYLRFSALLTLTLSGLTASATHIQGGNITYDCIGPNQYNVTLTMFFDCGTYNINTAPFNLSLTVTNDCGLANPALPLTWVGAQSNIDVSQLCAAQSAQSECASPPGTLPGVWQATWTGTITLPAACDSWHFWYSTCCWNSNTNTPGTPGQLYHTTLDNTIATCDDSPTFPGQQIPYLCVNQTNTYSVGGSDPDGNTLVYAIVPAQEGSAGAPTNVPYNGGYTGTSPIPGITINPATGVITVSPTLTGNYIMQVDVASYDSNGNLIGVVSHQFQIIVVNCSNLVPTTSAAITNISGQIVQTGPLQLETCEGSNWCFTFTVSDPDAGSAITIATNVQTLFPGSTVTITGSNPWNVQVCGLATAASAPQNNLVFNIEDNACPIPGIATFTVQLDVIASTYAGPDQYYCPGGSTIILNATGGSVFNWSPSAGLSCTNCPSPVATPSVTTTYTVTSNLTGGCVNTDQVTVFVVPSFTLTMNPTSATICKYGSVQLNATPGAGGAPYTYSWTPTTGLSCTNCPNPVASPLSSTVYTLTTTSAAGCQRTDNVTVNVVGVAPNIIASAVDTTLCAGSGTPMSTVIYPDVCATTTLACTGAANTITVGTGTFSTVSYSPYYLPASPTAYSNRMQYLITAAELNAMGFVGGGKITSIGLNFTTAGSNTSGMEIKMGCTTLPMFPSGTYETGLTTVRPAFAFNPAIGWNTFTLTNAYLWDGTSNLLVEFCLNTAQSGTAASIQYNTYGANYYTIYYTTTVSGACSIATGTRTTVRPNMQFTFCQANPPVTYSWTPSTGLSSTTSPSPTATPGSTITYTVSATSGGCTGTDQITIYVVPNFNVTMSPTSATICLNNDVQLNATPTVAGTYTYSWSPTAGLNNPNIANPIASPSSTTTYTCTVTSAGGCTRTNTVTVTVSGSAPNVVATVLDNTVCVGATTTLGTIIYPDLCTTTALACTGPVNTVTVGAGTFSTTSYSPYYTSATAYSNRMQYLFTAAELSAMGFVGGGKITSIALNFTNAGTGLTGMVIKMGCTSLTQFPDGNYVTGLSTVKTAFNQVPVAGWNTFALTNAYLWDGISNLIVEFCVDNAQTGTAASVQYNTYGSSYYTIYYLTTANGSCSVVTGTRTTVRPNMQFTYCAAVPAYTYSWTPTTGVTSPTSSTTTVNPPTGTTTYQVSVTNGGCAGVSTVVVNEVPTFTLTMPANSTLCQNNSYQLNATPSVAGTYSYSWSPTTGLSNPTIANPVATPMSTTTYTVSVTNSAGCTITGTVTVTVSGVAPIVQATVLDNTVCAGATTQLGVIVYPTSCTTTALACTGPASVATVGTGTTSTTTYSPSYTSATAYGNRKLYLYTAAELNAAGFTGGGKITSIAINYTTVGTALTGMVVKMGCTSLTQFADGNFIPALTTVKTSFTLTPVMGWNTLTLSSPYLWDGISNLLVEFCVDVAQTGTASSVMYSSTSPNYYHIYYNSTIATGNCSATLGTRTTVRPNMQFNFCQAVPAYSYTWTPTTGVTTPTSASTVVNPPAGSTTYQVSVTNGGCAGVSTVSVSEVPAFTLTMSPNSTICQNNNYQLNATPSVAGTYTYSWSPTTGLTNPNIANPVASPGSTTLYTVSVTNSVGCTITGTVNVTVSGLAPIVGITAADNPVCPNVPNGLSALVYPATCTTTAAACTGPVQTVTAGSQTSSTTTYSPYYTSATAYGNRKLYLYTAAELSAAGFTGGGKITSIALNFPSTLGNALTGMTIKMGCTSLAQFADGNFIPALTTVKTAFSQAPVAGWNTFTLTTAYMWDGVSNLLVEFCVDAAQTGTATYVEYSSTSPNYYHIYYNSTSVSGNCSVATGTRTTVRPNMRFTFCPSIPAGYTYSWSPPTGLSSTSVANPTSTILTNQTYTLTVSSGGCSGSGSITVNIDNTNTVTATPTPDPTYCPSQLVQLNAVPSGPTAPVYLPSCGTSAAACTQPQTYYTVGTGVSSSTSYSPFYQSYADNKDQYLIRASELTAAGIPSGTIREIAWNVISKSSTLAYTGFTISMGCTNETTLSTVTGWLPVTTVWTGNYTSVLGWNNFVLTNPYMWNGTSNIVVQVCYNNGNGQASIGDATQYSTGFAYNATMYYYSSSNGDQGCNLAATYVTTARPNIRFRVCPPPPNNFTYSWTPPLAVSNPTIANPTTFPAATTQYVVTVAGGVCTVYDTVNVLVCPVILPVELLSFTGKNVGNENVVNWSTSTEVNCDYFMLERANHSNTFESIAMLDGGGNTNEIRNYEWVDEQPYPGINYYRLKQYDFNGVYKYSNIITVYRSIGEPQIMLSPNPTDGDLLIDITKDIPGHVRIELYDVRGSVLLNKNVSTTEGKSSYLMDLSQLSTDVYILKVHFIDQGYSKIFRVVKN